MGGASAPQAPPVTRAGPGRDSPAAPAPGLTAEAGRTRLWLLVLACPGSGGAAGGAGRRLVYTMWMPRSCLSMCMNASSTPYDPVRAVPE